MLQVGMMSGWHVHAKDYGNDLRKMPDVGIAAVWDEDPKRGAEWAAELEVPFEPHRDAFLARKDFDAVVVCAPTNRHAEVMVAAAQAGKHIFTEKVMALTVKECQAIAQAVRQAGVKFAISFPARTQPGHLFAKQTVEQGTIGDVTLLRVRVAHDGASAGWLVPHFYDLEACGGGAMMDLGAHPMYLARWIMGRPLAVVSGFGNVTGHAVEDNSVSIVEFEKGCLAVVETGFVSTHSPSTLELHGTEGCLVVGGPTGGVQLISNKEGLSEKGWHAPDSLPQPLPSPLRMWVDAILNDAPILFGLEEGTQLTELMEAAYKSYREGRRVEIPHR